MLTINRNNEFGRISFTKVKTEMERITPNDAQLLLNFAYEGQREIKDRHVNYLQQCLELGEFNPLDPITILQCTKTGKIGLPNGNHRMRLIVKIGSPLMINVTRVFSSNFEEDFAWLYATFDKNKTRTNGDILAVYGEHKQLDITTTQAATIAKAGDLIESGFATHRCGLDYNSKSSVRFHNLLVNNASPGKLYITSIEGAGKGLSKVLSTRDVTAVGIEMYNNPDFDSAKVSEFWKELASGVYSKDSAGKVLAESMLDGWSRRSPENKRNIILSMYDRWLAGAVCERISAYRKPSKSIAAKKGKKGVSLTIIGSNNSVQI